MPEPIEAEFAAPPIFSPAQEKHMQHAPIGDLHDDPDVTANPSPTTTAAPSVHQHTTMHDAELEAGEKFTLVEFTPGTGEDPKEWGKGKKWFVTLGMSALCLAVALGSAMPTGNLPAQAETLEVSREAIYLSITLFVVGFGVGPLLFAPLSEMIGRKPVYMISMFFYFIFTLPSALAQNIGTMLVCRLIAGTASSAPMTNVGGTIADIWDASERGVPMAVFSLTIFMGPCLGPLLGGWIWVGTHSWRWIYWVLFIFLGLIFAFTLFAPETYAPILLKKKAARLRKEHNTNAYRAASEMQRVSLSTTLKISLTRPFIMMFRETIIFCMSIYLSFIYSLLYLLFFAFPIAFEEVRGWNPGTTGTAFVAVMIGIMLSFLGLQYQEVLYAKATVNGARAEARLYPMMAGSIILPIALFVFAFTGGYEWVHWIGPCFGGGLFGLAMLSVYVSANSYIVDSYTEYAASAMAAKTLMRSLAGASVPLWVTQMFHNMGFQYAGLLLALIACVIAPIPFLFYFKGEAVRMRSTRATK
ncbi:hypothetical protein NliqN6_2416 [Naganishia liquefaciens]|uniref:Major facilitator superfamily (MFS) profile domain-containing protein n=1 Tax=Naganishia liquefaciens TaxID=104408 RepID=A0A8H3TTN5_9TREE|nr:hypothetical protein NliqN6_2416 [Naganishia liquefaciens]